MELKELFKKLKFNWRNVCIDIDPRSLHVHQFQITPQDFLDYAREDFRCADARGIVNALTNAKRAIDCQTDTILDCFGFDPFRNLPATARSFINDYQAIHGRFEATQKLKLLQAIGAAPHGLLTRVRRLRHRLEHEYEFPDKDDVQEAIEVASLFIGATNYFVSRFENVPVLYSDEGFDPHIIIGYDQEKHVFTITAEDDWGNKYFEEVKVGLNNKLYLSLLKLQGALGTGEGVKDSLQELLRAVNHPVPEMSVTVKVVEI